MKNFLFIKKLIYFVFTIFVLGLMGSCNNESTVIPSDNISVSLVTGSSTTRLLADSIQIDTAKILITDIRLHKTSDSSTITIGPIIVYLNLTGTINEIALADIPAGTYDKISFKIHKPEDNEVISDPEFGGQGSERYSVIIKGLYNGSSFTYKSKKSAHQKITVDPPITTTEDALFNVTLTVDPNTWFIGNSGEVLDPNNPDNENDIDNNIKDSFFKAFKDNDKNGIADN